MLTEEQKLFLMGKRLYFVRATKNELDAIEKATGKREPMLQEIGPIVGFRPNGETSEYIVMAPALGFSEGPTYDISILRDPALPGLAPIPEGDWVPPETWKVWLSPEAAWEASKQFLEEE